MLDLIRRLPFTKIEEYVEALIQLSPDYADGLSGNVDQPLKLCVDSVTREEYIACVYNQDGESHWCVTFSSSFRIAAVVRWRIWGWGGGTCDGTHLGVGRGGLCLAYPRCFV
jgi:hypothetical protein